MEEVWIFPGTVQSVKFVHSCCHRKSGAELPEVKYWVTRCSPRRLVPKEPTMIYMKFPQRARQKWTQQAPIELEIPILMFVDFMMIVRWCRGCMGCRAWL